MEAHEVTDTTTDVTTVETAIETLLAEYPPDATEPGVFWGAQFDAGLAFVDFPVGHGGLS